MEKSCVYFMLGNGTEINTDVIHDRDTTEQDIILMAKMQLIGQLGINVDVLVKLVGKNECHDGKWYLVDFVEYVK